MNVLMATDGSTYGQGGLNWVATLPFVKPPRVTALHVLDRAWLRGPFRTRPEILRVEARSARTLKKAKQQLTSLKLKGKARKEQGAVAPVILKREPKVDGLLMVGSQGLDALDRFLLGSVSTRVVQHATCGARRSTTAQEAPGSPGPVSWGIEWGDWLTAPISIGRSPYAMVASSARGGS